MLVIGISGDWIVNFFGYGVEFFDLRQLNSLDTLLDGINKSSNDVYETSDFFLDGINKSCNDVYDETYGFLLDRIDESFDDLYEINETPKLDGRRIL